MSAHPSSTPSSGSNSSISGAIGAGFANTIFSAMSLVTASADLVMRGNIPGEQSAGAAHKGHDH